MTSAAGRLSGVAVLALAALTAAGCGSDSSNGSDAASQAASKASSAASSIAGQVGSAASQAASSASSAASSAISQIKGGVDAAGDVTAGAAKIDSDGKAVSELKVANPTADAHDYTISVAFDDPNGNLLDAVVVNASQVPANGTATAEARSNRQLTGTVTAKVTAAVRH
ncbi:hypothetical protein GCM10009839_62680 [Catenulispora yoronensis]|uniref:Lipoprotein n=2 Tax=Catenulispora yoronensis TaxID=450799 RepID=A0ABP5GJT6_9ACTN